MKIYNMAQRSPEWYAVRAGVPTASRFHTVVVEGQGRDTYLHQLVAEIISGEKIPTPATADMQRGIELEPIVRQQYESRQDCAIEQVGFVLADHGAGCSPDGLIGATGLWECKTVKQERLSNFLAKGSTGKKYHAQCQGQMWICQRDWCHLSVYAEGLPMMIEHIARNDQYIEQQLAPAVQRLIEDRDRLVARWRAQADAPGQWEGQFS